MISAEEFIDILEQKDLLDPSLVRDLRRRVEQSMAPVSAALLAKRLVDKGHLSRKLAQRLLDRAEDEVIEAPLEQEPDERKPDVANLGLAPLEEDEVEEADLETTEEEDWGLQELDDEKPWVPPAPAPPPVAPAAPLKPAVPVRPATPIPPPAAIPPAPVVLPMASLADGLEEIQEIGGPLDGLEQVDSSAGPLDGTLNGSRRGRNRKKGDKGEKRNVWDTSLMLIGGGVLLFLILLMIVLIAVLSGRGADTMLAQADEYYSQGSYTQAEDIYSQFVKRFPKHPDVGRARIRLGLAKMRKTVGGEWPHALNVAQAEIPLISGEELFATEARPELASMLPDIAEGLANKAQTSQDGKTADLADEALALVEKYIPSTARPQDRLQDIEALIALTRREIARTEQLATTVAEMVKAAEEGRPQDGYKLRRALLKEYPVLFDAPSLADAVKIVSTAEQAAVQGVDQTVSALTEEPESKAVATIALAQRSIKAPVSGVDEQRVFVVAGGAVYGLAAADGKVLWRRDIGLEENLRASQFPPTPISDRPGADPLLVSRQRQEVLRVDGASGKIRWRFPVGEAFDAHPVVFDGRVYIATLSGRLLSLDLEAGNSARYLQLPQPLRVGPAADSGKNTLYQVGEHSSLFVLSATDGTCSSVAYLGHEPGSIIVAPVRLSHYLLVCENAGVRDSIVKVLDINPPASETDPSPVRLVQEIRLKGHLYTAPIVHSPQVLFVTDSGAISVFQLTGDESKQPLSLSAEGMTAGEDRAELVRYASMATGQIWIADSQLTQYAVRASESRLNSSWIVNQASVSLQPPIVAGPAVIQVRHRRGMPGVAVSAVSVEKGEPLWETMLAAPAVGPPAADSTTRTLVAATATGGVFQVPPPGDGEIAVRDDPSGMIPAAELTGPIEHVLRFPSGLIAMIPAGNPLDIPVFELGKTAGEVRLRHVGLKDPLSGDAIVFADGLLAPTAGGQIFLLDPRTGVEMAEPFQPVLEPGRKYVWSRPATIGNDQFVVADDSSGIHRAVMKTDPKKQFALAATARLDDPATSPIAVLGSGVYAVDRADTLVRLDLPDLTGKTQKPLGAKCVLGPLTVGESVVLVTGDNRMHVIDSSGKMRSDELPYGTPLGEPVVDGAGWLMASASGVVWRVNPSTGQQLGKQETGLALGSGVALFGNRLLVAGHDGTLCLIEKP